MNTKQSKKKEDKIHRSKYEREVENMIECLESGRDVTELKTKVGPRLPHLDQINYNLPRRYDVTEMLLRKEPRKLQLLKNETGIIKIDDKMARLGKTTVEEYRKKVKKAYKINKTPLKKYDFRKKKKRGRDNNMVLFNDIFVQPRKERLESLKKNTEIKDEETKKQDKILKMYQEKEAKKFRIYEEEEPDEALEKMRELTKKPDNYEIYNKSLLKKLSKGNLKESKSLRKNASKSVMYSKTYQKTLLENVSMSLIANDSTELNARNQSVEFLGADKGPENNEKMIFNQQIQVEPPDLPNAHSSSPIAPGLGWAPSIPYIVEDEGRLSVSDLLTRARAGMQAGEVQQEAHLSFYLGITYENKKKYKKSIKHLKRYFNSAKTLEDKIGMAFAMNRIGVNYHKLGNDEKSLSYHLKNIELSDFENVFAGYYNAGISCRRLGRLMESQDNLKKALDWSISKNDIETECLVYGQIGITKAAMGDYETALNSLTKCKDMSRHIDNLRLNLDSLICISNIKFKMKKDHNKTGAKELFKEALSYAEELDDQKYTLNCVASLGILEGEKKFGEFLNQVKSGRIGNIKPTDYECDFKRTNGMIKEEIGFQEQ